MTETSAHRERPLWRRLVRVLTAIELAIGVACILVILALVFFQAVQRYLPIDQIAWTGELSRFGLVWLTFSAAGLLITTRGHIALEIVDTAKNQMLVRVVQCFAMVAVAVIGVLLTFEAVELIDSQGIIKSAVLRVPMSWVYIPVLIGIVSMTVRSLVQAVQIAVHGPIFTEVDDEADQAGVAA